MWESTVKIDAVVRGKRVFFTRIAIAFCILFFAAPLRALARQPAPDFPTTYSAPLVGSDDLIDNPDKYDGKPVSFKGEVIGDVMERADGAWINVNDDPYSRQGQKLYLAGYNRGQSILVTDKDSAKAIGITGDYTHRGDIIKASGIFYKASPDYGGDMMILADHVRVIKPGFVIDHPISSRKIGLAITWLAISGVVFALWHRRKFLVKFQR